MCVGVRCVSPEGVLEVVPPGQGDGAEEALDSGHGVQLQGLGQVLEPGQRTLSG